MALDKAGFGGNPYACRSMDGHPHGVKAGTQHPDRVANAAGLHRAAMRVALLEIEPRSARERSLPPTGQLSLALVFLLAWPATPGAATKDAAWLTALAVSAGSSSMSTWLRRRLVQRVFAALFVATFLPLATVAHACQAVRHLAAADLWTTPPVSMHVQETPAADHGLAGREPAKVLGYMGPCHLLVTAALPADLSHAKPMPADASWPRSTECRFASRSWPPPKHRPRLG